MKSVFISYRRKDTADIAGRLFDRLSGYFGPGSTLLDVDALVAGGNYRTQIERHIERCGVVLAVVGREWLTATDDSGRRRLDNPDDQLRIEIAVALKAGREVIPILVHGAALPAADDLPDELKALAACEPHALQSGAPFNADVQFLLERLQSHGLRPPESTFPWQFVLIPLGLVVLIAGILEVLLGTSFAQEDDFVLQQIDPGASLSELRYMSDWELERFDGLPYDVARFDRRTLWQVLAIMLPLGLGPMLLVWGKRRCCLGKERIEAIRHYGRGAGRLPTPKSGKSVLCLALGLASTGFGAFTAVPSLILAAVAWLELRSHPTWIRGRSLLAVGVVASFVGLAVSYYYHWGTWQFRSWLVAMEQGDGRFQDGNLDDALAVFGNAAALTPRNELTEPVSRIRRARIFGERQEVEKSVVELTAAIEALQSNSDDYMRNPAGPEAAIVGMSYAERAAAYEALGQFAEADADRQNDTRLLRADGTQTPTGVYVPSSDAGVDRDTMRPPAPAAPPSAPDDDEATPAPPPPA